MSAPKRFLTSQLPRIGSPVLLDRDEAHHAVKVMRLQDGDHVFVLDGRGSGVTGVMRVKKGSQTHVFIEAAGSPVDEPPGAVLPIHMNLAMLKGDAMDWCIEKCVELGISAVTPLETEHTVVQTKKKGGESFQSRWQTISDQSLKQCERLTRMIVHTPVSLEERLAHLGQEKGIWLAERSTSSKSLGTLLQELSSPIHLFSGPEGGWSHQEKELFSRSKNMIAASLGPLVLRGETAVIASASIVAEGLRAR